MKVKLRHDKLPLNKVKTMQKRGGPTNQPVLRIINIVLILKVMQDLILGVIIVDTVSILNGSTCVDEPHPPVPRCWWPA